MEVNNETLEQLRTLNEKDLVELIHTICSSAAVSETSQETKIIIGTLLLNYGTEVLENEGCHLALTIGHKNWLDAIQYNSGVMV